MRYHDNYNWVDLSPCPVCGKFAGARKVSLSIPEKFFVVCESCGHKTKPYNEQRYATRAWNNERR